MQTIVRNAVLDLDNPDFSTLPDKIKVVADKNLLKIETSIRVDVDGKDMGRKLWDDVLCSLIGIVVTASVGYATGVLKASSSLIIILYLFVGVIGILFSSPPCYLKNTWLKSCLSRRSSSDCRTNLILVNFVCEIFHTSRPYK